MRKVFSKIPALLSFAVFHLLFFFLSSTGALAQESGEMRREGKIEVTDKQIEVVLEKIISEKLDRIIERRLRESNEEFESNDDEINRLENELEEEGKDDSAYEDEYSEDEGGDESEAIDEGDQGKVGEEQEEISDASEEFIHKEEVERELLTSEGDVVINELMANPKQGENEWIELYNASGGVISLEDWKIVGTKVVFSADVKIGAGEFLLVDLESRRELNNSGETLALQDDLGADISVVNFSTAPENQSYARKPDGTYQWTSEVTPGAENEFSSLEDDKDDEEAGEQKPSFQTEDISITELLPNPAGSDSGNEWIELYNNTGKEIYLKGWTMKDTSKTVHEFSEQFSIPSKEYRIFPPKFTLNNSGEEKIELFDPVDNLISQAVYRDAPESQSWARAKDGQFAWTKVLTPEEANEFNKQENNETENKKLVGDFPQLIFSEIFSNPIGVDSGKEWLEIFNPGQKSVDLQGWLLENSSGKNLVLAGKIESRQYRLIELRREDNFSLRNLDEEVILKNPKGEKSDQIALEGSAPTAQSFSRQQSGVWQWTKYLTPGEQNKFNRRPEIKVKIPKEIYPGRYFEIDASGTKDEDNDKLRFTWEWEDGKKSYQQKIRKKFEEVGKYEFILSVSDGMETVKKKLRVKVKKYPPENIVIVGLKPNPRGVDFRHEFIEIENRSEREIDLQDWEIATAGKSAGSPTAKKITKEIKLKPKQRCKIFNDEDCRFGLSNTGGLVELRYPDGELADLVEYDKDKIGEDEEYLQRFDQWRWVLGGEEIVQTEEENSDTEWSGNDQSEESDSIQAHWHWWEVIWDEKIGWCESLNGLSYGNWLNKNRPYFDVAGWRFRQVD